jgi:WD40 repeat protein
VILSGLTVFALISRSLAVRNEHEARQETVRALTNLGLQAEEQGRTATALHHWAAAIRVARNDDSSQRANRLRLGTRAQQMFQLVAMLEHGTELRSAKFHPASSRLVTTADRTGRIWDVATQSLIHELQHADAVNYAEFSPDGKHVLTSGVKARIWNAESGELQLELDSGLAYHAAYIAQGKSIMTRGETIRVWDVETGRLVWEDLPSPMSPAIESFGRLFSAGHDDEEHSLLLIETSKGVQTTDEFLLQFCFEDRRQP